MLATLNAKQIVDEIVKDTVKDNDPHDAVQISPEIVLASRPVNVSPALATEIAPRPEPKFAPEPKFVPEPPRAPEPTINVVYGKAAAAPPVDTAIRVTTSDGLVTRKRSAAGKWLRGAFVAFLFAGGSVAASIAWEQHGDTAKQILAEWKPVLASLMPSTSQTMPVAAVQADDGPAQAAVEQSVVPSASPPTQAGVPPAAAQPDPAQLVQSMSNDLAAMAQQIEQLKANIAELKAGQEQMAREMAKPAAQGPAAAETKPVDSRARAAASPPQPSAQRVRKPKPPVTRTYSPTPLAPPPPPSQASAAPPPAAAVATTQAVADDDGPIVRPPMPLR